MSQWSRLQQASLVRIDVSAVDELRVTGAIEGIQVVDFLGQTYNLIDRRQSADQRFSYLTLGHSFPDGMDTAVVILDTTFNGVVAFANGWGTQRVVLPLLDRITGHNINGLHVLAIYTPADVADDQSLLRSPRPAPIPGAASPPTSTLVPSATPKSRLDKESPIPVLEKPLVIYAAYTDRAAAMAEASSPYTPPWTLVESQTATMIDAFERAGVRADVELLLPERVEFEQPLDTTDWDLAKFALEDLVAGDKLEDFRKRRQQLQADVGILVVHHKDPTQCGGASALPANASNALVVVNWRCIGGLHTVLHEIGHLLGAWHESVDPESRGQPRDARALVVSDDDRPFVTVMGRTQRCGKTVCGRIAKFSNPQDFLHDRALGKPGRIDNARTVRKGLALAVHFGEELAGSLGAVTPALAYATGTQSAWSADEDEFEKLASRLEASIASVVNARRDIADASGVPNHCLYPRLLSAAMRFRYAAATVNSVKVRDYAIENADPRNGPQEQFPTPGVIDAKWKTYMNALLEWAAPSLMPLSDVELVHMRAEKAECGS